MYLSLSFHHCTPLHSISILPPSLNHSLMPGSEPLFTVGAIAQDIANFGNGFLFSFDRSGSAGTAYQAVGNKKPDRNLTSTESLLNLTKVNAVNMNSLVVTQDAIPLTSGFSAFVVDKVFFSYVYTLEKGKRCTLYTRNGLCLYVEYLRLAYISSPLMTTCTL